ncbi:MAG: TadE/TadG family type IV pilus assembly protein [Rhodovulum sp.]
MGRLFTAPFRRFARDSRGNMVMELLLVMPFFIWAILGIIIYFYGFHMKTLNQTGAYTISDLISRQQEGPITPADIEGLDEMFAFLTDTPDKMGRIRVTLVYCEKDCDTTARDLDIDWSYGTDNAQPMTEAELADTFDSKIPILPENERVILVETQVLYRPPVWFGVFPRTLDSFVATRPRFVPKLEWDEGSDSV